MHRTALLDSAPVDDRLPRIFEPATMLPSQFFDRLKSRSRYRGEHRLMIAILEDAVRTYVRQVGTRNRGRQQLFRKAEAWIESSNRTWVFSFERICDALNLDASYLRRGLRDCKKRALAGEPPLVIALREVQAEEDRRRAAAAD